MFDVLRDEVRQRLPEPIKKLTLRWYRKAMLHPYFLALLACMFICWLGWALLGKEIVNWWAGSIDKPYENAAQLGDSFGTLNTLFAGIAAIGATLAYFEQAKQLRGAQAEAGKVEAAENKKQFESRFFQLLNVLHEIVASTECGKKSGRDALQAMGDELAISIKTKIREYRSPARDAFLKPYEEERKRKSGAESSRDWQIRQMGLNSSEIADVLNRPPLPPLTEQEEKTACSKCYAEFYKKYSPQLSHYFRSLYRLLALVCRSNLTVRKDYGKIVRAQLSDAELLFIFWNGFLEQGHPMNFFVDEFALLKHLPHHEGYPTTEQRLWLKMEPRSNKAALSNPDEGRAFNDEE